MFLDVASARARPAWSLRRTFRAGPWFILLDTETERGLDELMNVQARPPGIEVREIYELDLKKASLVVLSACQTQLGAQSRSDDDVGLSRAFIYAVRAHCGRESVVGG